MAKDKELEKQYKEIGLVRANKRKIERKARRAHKIWLHGPSGRGICPYCGNHMTWCSSCQMWSSYCCEEYGTCMCS